MNVDVDGPRPRDSTLVDLDELSGDYLEASECDGQREDVGADKVQLDRL